MRRRREPRASGRRVAALVVAIGALYAAWTIGRVRAQGHERMLALGEGLSRLTPEAGPRVVEINGARVRVSSVLTDAPLERVIDGAYASCLEAPRDAAALAAPRDAEAPSWLDPVTRWQEDGEGFVGCLGARAGSDRWEVFARSFDLEDVGGFRYAYAREGRGPDGRPRTRVIAVRSEGPFALEAMFPREGDAPGFDLDGVPRPDGARRVLSVREPDVGRALTVHRAPPGRSLIAGSRAGLERAGWRVRDVQGTLHADRGADALVVSFGEDARGTWATAVRDGLPSRAGAPR